VPACGPGVAACGSPSAGEASGSFLFGLGHSTSGFFALASASPFAISCGRTGGAGLGTVAWGDVSTPGPLVPGAPCRGTPPTPWSGSEAPPGCHCGFCPEGGAGCGGGGGAGEGGGGGSFGGAALGVAGGFGAAGAAKSSLILISTRGLGAVVYVMP